jgi:hypothetical protein
MSEEVKSASESKKEDWMNSKWRPMMGWMYMLVCTMDMVIFPILWSLLQTTVGTGLTQWNPLTLQGAGLFHIAMGAVLGIAAFGRTQEKLGGANNGGIQSPGTGFASGPSTFSQPPSGFGAASGTSFTPAPSWGTTPIPGSGNSNPGFGATAAAPRSFSSAPLGAAAVGAAGGFAAATMMPAMDKPMPSRPPFEEDFPEID